MKKQVILIVDDDRNTREGLARALGGKYDIILAEQADKALDILRETPVDVMLTDIRMPGMDGLTLLQRARARIPSPVCILMTAYGSIEKAVEAMRNGAADFVTKPYNLDDLETRIEKALRSRACEERNVELQQQLDDRYGLDGIIGNSEPMRDLFEIIKQVAPTSATVLLQGESGTGKELVARAIHRLSPRAAGPFIAVHCAALSPGLMESELFGHEKGAFTGANERRTGRFELANGGTLFLDEVSEIAAATQVKLLRVLEEQCFERVGGQKTIEVDIRLVSATNIDLKKAVDEGAFRSDLFFRLNVVNVRLPPLRERREDIPLLCAKFVEEFSAVNNKKPRGISPDAMAALTDYSWPGNVRECRNAIEKMVVLAKGKILTVDDLPGEIRAALNMSDYRGKAGGSFGGFTPQSMGEAERMMILDALKKNGGNRTNAAKQLGISRRTLHRKLKEYQQTGAGQAVERPTLNIEHAKW